MKRYIAFAAAFVVSAAAVMAQAPEPQSAAGSQQAVTVTGCLQSGSGGAAGATTGGEFVLANAQIGSAGSSSPSSPTAKPPSAKPPSATPPSATPPTTTPPTTTPPPSTPPPSTPPPSTPPPSTPPPSTPPPSTPPTTTPPPSASPSAPVGTSGMAKGPSIRLTGGESESLQQYVNQRVEVQGQFQGEAGAAGAAGRTLKVTSVRPVPGNCAGGDK